MAYDEINEWIRDCLQDSLPLDEADDPDYSGFAKHIKSVLRDSIPKAAIAAAGVADSVAFYDALTGDDKDLLTEAVGLLVAARTIVPLTTGGANGQLLSEKTETISRTFANEPGSKAEWEARAKKLLADCSFAPATSSSLGIVSMFAAAGPSRARDEARRRDRG